MKRTFILLLAIFTAFNLYAQKIAVFPVEEYSVPVREGFLEGEKINIVLFDARSLPAKSKVECSSEEVVKTIGNIIEKAYSSAKINILPSDQYYKAAADSVITVRIAINAYQAGFSNALNGTVGSIGGTSAFGISTDGKWHGVTGYNVIIDDKRSEEPKRYTDNFSAEESHSNTLGFTTAKKCLSASFIQATDKLLVFIDGCLLQ